jgi:hypothetical protein
MDTFMHIFAFGAGAVITCGGITIMLLAAGIIGP